MKPSFYLLATAASMAFAGTANAVTITGSFSAALFGVASTPPAIGPGATLTNIIGLVTSSTADFNPAVSVLTSVNFATLTATNGTPVSFTSSFGNFSGLISGLTTVAAPNASVNFQSFGTFTPLGVLGGFAQGPGSLTVGFTQTGPLTSNNAISGSFTFSSAAVPEPESWALLVVGFGLIGVAARRRPRVVAA